MKTIGMCVWLTACLAAAGSLGSAEQDAPKYALHSGRRVGQIDQVETSLKIVGDRLVRDGAKGEKVKKVGVSVECNRDFDEKTLELPEGAAERWRSVRHYHRAVATVQVGTEVQRLTLRPENRLIGVEIGACKVTPFSPAGPLTEDEIELIRAVGIATLPLEGLLPSEPVAVGQKWRSSNEILAVLLDLEEVTANTVEIGVKEVTPAVARFELAGRVEGKRYGATNQITLAAKYRFDRETNRIDWFAMRVKQTRQVSLVEDGMEVTLLLQVQIAPKEASDFLTEAALKDLPLRATEDVCRMLYESAEGGWRLVHDRSWFLMQHSRDLDVFRRVEGGQDVALCKISSLPKGDPAKPVSLGQFQVDVQQALGRNFGEFLEASQYPTEAGYRVLRVVAKGTDGDVPVRWHYYHVADETGRQIAMAFRLDEKWDEMFGKASEQIVRGLQFVAPKSGAGAKK